MLYLGRGNMKMISWILINYIMHLICISKDSAKMFINTNIVTESIINAETPTPKCPMSVNRNQ